MRFLRGNLDGRFADVAVPLAVLAAWSLAATRTIVRSGRIEVGTRVLRLGGVARGLVATAALVVALITAGILVRPAREAIGNSSLLDGLSSALSDADVTKRLQSTWPLDGWADGARGQTALSRYLQACTEPTDSILVAPIWPAVLGLAQRAFAGGHSDLRSGFFAAVEEQQLTVDRLQRQSVPIIIGPPSEELSSYAEAFPLVVDHVNREYENLGDKDLGDGVVFTLFVRDDARSVRTYEPLPSPCFRSVALID